MKIFKLFFTVLTVLIFVLIIAVVVFVSTFDINRYKKQIISRISEQLGRDVNFSSANLALSLEEGLSLKVKNLRVAENPAFAQEDFLSVKEASFVINVLGLIFNKKIDISGIQIDSPRIVLIREKDGNFNINSLLESGKKDKVKEDAGKEALPVALPSLLISSLKVNSGNAVFIDWLVEPKLSVEINQIDLEAKKISLNAAFPFIAEAAVLSSQKNIRLEAMVGADPKNSAVNVFGLQVKLDLGAIEPGKIPVYFPMAKEMNLPSALGGKLQLLFKDFTVSQKGLSVFSSEALLNNGYLQFKELASPIKDLVMSAKINQEDVHLDNISANLGEGRIEGALKLEDYLATQKYILAVNATDILTREIFAQDESTVALDGVVSLQIHLDGQNFAPEALKSNLSGEAQVKMLRPRLKNINVLRAVLDKITVIPGLSQTIEASLPELYRQKLTQKDTVFSNIDLPVAIANGQILLKKIILKADEFVFEGWGELGFEGGFLMEGSFMIPEQLSLAMVGAVSQLEYLLTAGNQIYIPLKVSGNASRLEFNVDAAYIAKKLLAQQGKKKLFRALDKALGIEDKPVQEGNLEASEDPNPDKQEVTPEGVVEGILQEILR